jgi:two-component system cell cycle sensor histidine kinase/response regulator CckA
VLPGRPELASTLLRILTVTAIVTAVVGALFSDVTTAGLGAVNAVCYALLLPLQRRGHGNAVGLIAVSTLAATAAFAMWTGDGIHDTATFILPVVVLIGGTMLARRYFVALLSLVVAVVLVVGAGEWLDWLPNDRYPVQGAVDFVVAPILLLASGAFIHLFVGAIHRSMAQAEASDRGYREVFNATNEAILIHDARDGRILDVNDTMLEMYGYSRAEALRLSVRDLSAERNEFTQERALERIRQAAARGPQVFEWLARRSDSTEFWVEVALRESTIGGHGRVLAVVRDIGERRRIHEQLRHSEKMEAVGQLAGGIAHDFNNQLAGIIGFAELLRVGADPGAPAARHAAGILTAANRAADLTAKLLAFARKGKNLSVSVDVHGLIGEVVSLLERSIDPSVTLQVELHAPRACVTGDPTQLQNALLNLALNARDAMPEGGTVTFRTESVVVGATTESIGSVTPGDYLRVEVSDTGVGMDEATRQRIFEPFFTTKPHGTGMGLAAVYGTIRAHRGGVQVVSSPGAGSTFSLLLPTASPDASAQPALRSAPPPPPVDAEVLIAEDEPAVAAMMVELLDHLGCRATVCPDGETAVRYYREEPHRFELVILDLTLPKMSGKDAFGEIRKINPTASVVIASGYTDDAKLENLLSAGAAAFLPKPFRLAHLAAVLDRALGRERRATAREARTS